MASGPTLPPQAYTREILTAAFNWLQSQPDSVRKMATTPDALVGLYLRAQRFGNSSLESDAPVSSQAFMSDLKNLAEGLKQFEDPKESRKLLHTTSQPSPSMQAPPPPQAMSSGAGAWSGFHQFQSPPMAPVAPLPQQLNERSWAMIQEVKSQLNLSSDVDAINMMVALAYKNLRNLLA